MEARDMRQIYEKFLSMEEEKDLFNILEVNHVKIWHYIRVGIYIMVRNILDEHENPEGGDIYFPEQHSIKDWIDEKIIKNQFMVGHRDFLIFNHSRRVKQGRYYKCIYTDEWLKGFDRSYYVFEKKYVGKKFFKPIKTKKLRYIDKGMYTKIFKRKYNTELYKKGIREATHYIMKVLTEEFNITPKLVYEKGIMETIAWRLSEIDLDKDYYTYIIKRVQPKVIMYVNAGDFDYMIITEIAKKLGIPTIEIQHGHIGKETLVYNFKGLENHPALPEYFFVVGQHAKKTARLPVSEENIYAVGSPEMDLKTEYYKKMLSVRKKRKRIVTFISCGEYEIADAAIELCQKLDKSRFKIYLKLHPGEYTNWKLKYKGLEHTGVYVADDEKHDIYYYLASSDFLIGCASTALFEATRFNCSILILRKGQYWCMESLIHVGSGIYIDSMEEAISYINNTNKERQESDYFYSRNSTQLIYEAVEDILQKNELN